MIYLKNHLYDWLQLCYKFEKMLKKLFDNTITFIDNIFIKSRNFAERVFIYIDKLFTSDKGNGMCKAIDIANTFIEIGKDKPIPVSNMKLQKLLYYAQGWTMAFMSKPLIDEDFYKWNFGPVIPEIYNVFKENGGEPILCTSSKGKLIEDNSTLDFLNWIWSVYGDYTGIELSNLSHNESPWKETENYKKIPKEKIHKYFCGELNKINKSQE